jgi:hypothetical protein
LLARAPHPLAAGKKMIARKESSKEKREEAERRKEKEKTRNWMKMGGVEEIATWSAPCSWAGTGRIDRVVASVWATVESVLGWESIRLLCWIEGLIDLHPAKQN